MAILNPTQLTPPRVALIDERTGAISREWYRFFLSLLTATQENQDQSEVGPDTDSLLASYDAVFNDFAQAVGQQPDANAAVADLDAKLNSLSFGFSLQPRPELGTMAPLQQANIPWVTFDNAPEVIPTAVGSLYWDGGTTLGVQMTTNVLGRVNEDLFYYAKASSAITKGQVVMFTGAVGASGVPTGAPATGVTDGSYIMGVAAESIALNGFGLIQYNGTLKGIDTSAFADGDILWYDPAVTGGLTKTKPSAPNVKVQMAAVINAGSGGSGTILIRVNAGSVLGGTDSNVQFGTLADKDIIQYYGAGGYWRNVAYSNVTVGYADNLTGGAANKIVYQTALNTTGFIDAPSVASTVLTWSGSAFTWTTPTTGTVTSVNVSGGTTGLTFSGGPITSSGTITMAGTLGVGYGGTGTTTTFTTGSVVFAGASGVYTQNNANFFWDNTNARLGLGTTGPAQRLHVRQDLDGTIGVLIHNRNGTGAPVAAVQFISGAFDLSDSRYAQITSDGGSSNFLKFWTGNGAAPTQKMQIDNNGNVCIGTTTVAALLTVNGSMALNAPVSVTGATYSVATTDNWIIANRAGTVTLTLPTASSFVGRILTVKNVQAQTVVSASSNVVPIGATAAGTAILAATAGKFAKLVSDGTNWITMEAN